MHDPRTSPALRALAELTGEPAHSRWRWSIKRLDDAGRLCLGRRLAAVLGDGALDLHWHRLALVVEADGHDVRLDDRARLLVPAWLRDRGRDVLVGLDVERRRLLVVPVEVLDRFGDVLAGGPR